MSTSETSASRGRIDDEDTLPWLLPAVEFAGAPSSIKQSLRGRSGRGWLNSTVASVPWMIFPLLTIVNGGGSPGYRALGVVLMALFAFAFVLSVPLIWSRPLLKRVLIGAAMFAYTLALIPWLGQGVTFLWTYVGVIFAMSVLPWGLTLGLIGALALGAAAVEFVISGWSDSVLNAPLTIGTISLMLAAFFRQITVSNQLRRTQANLEVMVVERERDRVARDLHDILGHSLTVISMKAELAERLIDVDPARAQTELAELAELSRATLSDARATVASVRIVNVSAELAAARSTLAAANIDAELPGSTDVVPGSRRELAGWVVREGVTNVLRHSGATRCRIRLSATEIEIDDNGRGPDLIADGNGLRGLRERVDAAGGSLWMGTGELGGFCLRVTFSPTSTATPTASAK